MKGLMVSLIIVILAGMTSSTAIASQQSGDKAAGFAPRLGLQPIPSFERPGPDDSEDDINSPIPTSLLSRNSTITSGSNSFGAQQFGGPSPQRATPQNIRFEVKVDDNAVEMMRQGQKVVSTVDIRDQTTNTPLDPSVVSDIALFHTNAKENLKRVRLNPQPMEPGSTTLRFEIQEQELDRFKDDAFLFSVPDNLRGKFDHVEFIAVSNSSNQKFFQGFSNDSGSNSRLENTNGIDRMARLDPWRNNNLPQPGPNFEPGGSDFIGPYIDPNELESRRNQVAPIDPNRNFVQRNRFPQQQDNIRSPLNTNGGFRTAEREPEVRPKSNPLGRPFEWPNNNQTTFNDRQANQQNNQTLADQQLRDLQQQLAHAKADANNWQQAANRVQNELDHQSRIANNQSSAQQPTSPNYWNKAANMISPYGSQRQGTQKQETDFSRVMEEMQRKINSLEVVLADKQLERERSHRGGPDQSVVQQTSYNKDYPRTAEATHAFDTQRPSYNPPKTAQQEIPKQQDRIMDPADGDRNNQSQKRSSKSDLIWLLPLLLGSLGLNLFLWLHSRSLQLQYTDLAIELREMVGASTA